MGSDLIYKLGGSLVIALGMYLAGYATGYRHASTAAERNADRATITSQQHVIQTERAQQTVTASAAAAHEASAAATRTIYKTIDREVIRYVQASAPVCRLPAGWVRLHDAAALSAIPAAPGEPDAAASPFTTDDALGVVTSNYETCEQTRQQLTGLQGWVKAQQTVAE